MTVWSFDNPHPPEPPPKEFPAEVGIHIWRTAVIMPFITFIFVALRFYSRAFITKAFKASDWVAFATMPFIIAYSVLIAIATYHGMGIHVWQFTTKLEEDYFFWLSVASEFYVMSLMGYKVALLLLYLQIFNVVKRFNIACYITIFYTVGYLFCNLMTEFLGCDPPAKTYKADLPGHCINTVAANIAYGAGHMSSDLIIAILPLPMIWRLQLKSTREKVGISIVLGSGFIAWAIACVRYAVSTYDMVSYDRSWLAGIGFLFSILEVNTGLICACIPTLKPLLKIAKESASQYYGSRKGSLPWNSFRKGSTSAATASKNSTKNSSKNWSDRSGSNASDEKPLKVPKKSMSLPHISNDSSTTMESQHEPIMPYEVYGHNYVDRNPPPPLPPSLLHNPASHYSGDNAV